MADYGAGDLRLVQLSKTFGDFTAVHPLDLSIPQGSFFALLGPSGCGKTTTLRMIAGLDLPTAGSIAIFGDEMADTPPNRRPVNTVFQEYALFPHLDVAENLLMGIQPTNFRGLRVDRRAMYRQASELLARIGVNIDTHTLAVGLSAADLLFVEIARALSADVRLLILDEPTAALDTESEQIVMEALERLMKGRTVITIAHRLSTIRSGHKIAVVKDGVVAEEGHHNELIERNGIYAELYRIQAGPTSDTEVPVGTPVSTDQEPTEDRG